MLLKASKEWKTGKKHRKKRIVGCCIHDFLIISNQIDFSINLTIIIIISHEVLSWLAKGIGCEMLFLNWFHFFSSSFPFTALCFVSRQKNINAKVFLVRKKHNGYNLGMTIDIAHIHTHTHSTYTYKRRENFRRMKHERRVRKMDLDIMKRVTGNKFCIIIFCSCSFRYGIEHAVDIQLLLCVISIGGITKCPTLW